MSNFREDLVTRTQGRFAHWQARESSGITLDLQKNRLTFAERFEKFKRNGFIAATTLDAVQSPSTTKDRDEWWNREFVAGEYGKSGKGYPQMPDDFTPAKSLGQAMSGNRRTHRMNYKNGDVDLRMPSATAIKRFSGENGNPTFDVPVSVSVKGGAPKQGWVRVTKTGPQTWSTTALGDTQDENSEILGEAVAAVLEARRPTMALHAAGDLLERRKARQAAEGQEMSGIKSTFIDEIGYDEGSSTMATQIGDKIYGHTVPKSFFESVANSERPGTLFNKLIKQNVQTEISRCQQCGRFSAASIQHTCPQSHKPVSGIGEDHLERARLRALSVASSRSGGVAPAAAANVIPAQPVVATAPAPGAPPVPVTKTGLPAPRRDKAAAPVAPAAAPRASKEELDKNLTYLDHAARLNGFQLRHDGPGHGATVSSSNGLSAITVKEDGTLERYENLSKVESFSSSAQTPAALEKFAASHAERMALITDGTVNGGYTAGLPAPRQTTMQLLDARRHMDKLRDLKPGTTVLVNGQEMQVQAYSPEAYGHPDNKSVLQVGYGAGRYNQEVSVARLAAGYVDIQVPPAMPATTAPAAAHLANPIMSQKAYFDEIQPLKEGARSSGYDLIANGVSRECEASTSTDTYFAHVSVDHEGQMKRFVNSKPVEAFDDRYRKAQQLEAWTAKNAFAMARITDAEKRRRPAAVPAV
ncbi:MAG TPA: hypothetical protein VF885_09170 [Arthrobacter sp.]